MYLGFIKKLTSILARCQNINSVREAAWFVGASYSGKLDPANTAKSMCDFKNSIDGQFSIKKEFPEAAILQSSRCPLGNVQGLDHVCGLTSGILGGMCAEHHGQSEVLIIRSIARGDEYCEVAVRWSKELPGIGDQYISTSQRYLNRRTKTRKYKEKVTCDI